MAMAPGGAVFVVEDDDGMREPIDRLVHAADFETTDHAAAEGWLI